MIRNLFLVLVLLTGNEAIGRAQYKISLVEHTLNCIKAPLLHAFANVEHAWDNASSPGSAPNQEQPKGMPYYGNYGKAVIPEFRKYQNSHIAPTRMITGGSAVAVGGIMMFEGYIQDTKYPWSGPSISLSPLNVFGVLIIITGLCFLASGYLFYLNYKKHTISPYNKSY